MKSLFLSLTVSLLGAASQLGAVVLTFENSNEFSGNFRVTATPGAGTIGQTDPADGSEPNNDFAFFEKTGGTAPGVLVAVYDTTPGSSADADLTFSDTITVTLDFAAVADNTSIGIYLFNPSNPSSDSLLVLFNVDTTLTDTPDQIRFYGDGAVLTTGATGTQITSGITGTGGTFHSTNGYTGDAGLDVSSHASPVFGTLTLVYTPGDLSDTLSLSIGGLTATATLTGANQLEVAPAIAIRLNDNSTSGSTSAKFDNFEVIPEPSPFAMSMLFGGVGMMSLLRRRRVS